jgi:predicted ribosomally synthesized peptide with nif11-like leader
MSLDSAKAFVKKFDGEAGFRDTILNAPTDQDRQKLVQQAGFTFTKAEMAQVIKEKQETELSDEQLKAVAGGKSATWTATGVTIGISVAAAGL